ncbi:hypothetical protein MUP29_13885 [bacterium]|nr:hypothetical protein [bacterium]
MIIRKLTGKRAGTFTCVVAVFAGLFFMCATAAYAVKDMPSSGEKQHMKLVGYNDLQGRESLQVTTKGNFVFGGHHNRPGTADIHFNPLTQEDEENGTTILNISDPANPILVVHIPNEGNRNSRSASVVYDFMGSGKDFMIRNSEGSGTWYFQVFDITEITRNNGTAYIEVGKLMSTPAGTLTQTAHKGYFSQGGLYYVGANEPGFRSGGHLIVWDMSDLPDVAPNANQDLGPGRFVGRAWLPGQKFSEPEMGSLSGHHPIVDEANGRVYMAYLTGGNVASFDIGSGPKGVDSRYDVAWAIDTDPPGSGTHTVSVIRYDEVPNFQESELPRIYAIVADEATGGDMWRFTDVPQGVRDGVRDKVYVFDVTNADEMEVPFPVETWQVPDGDYLSRGGRFGPHQFNETMDGELNLFEDKIAYVAYFNAGVRAIDISDPYNIKEVGYYVPQENERTGYIGGDQPSPNIQINDVDVDYRGLVYASGRTGSGLYILEYTGK